MNGAEISKKERQQRGEKSMSAAAANGQKPVPHQFASFSPFSPLKSGFFFIKPPKDKYKQSAVMVERWDLPFVVV